MLESISSFMEHGEILLRDNSLARACGKRFVIRIHKQKLLAIASLFVPIVSIPIIWQLLIVIPFTLALSRPNAECYCVLLV